MRVPPGQRGRTDEQASRVGVARHAESTMPSCLPGKPLPPRRPAHKAETFCSAGGWSSRVCPSAVGHARPRGLVVVSDLTSSKPSMAAAISP